MLFLCVVLVIKCKMSFILAKHCAQELQPQPSFVTAFNSRRSYSPAHLSEPCSLQSALLRKHRSLPPPQSPLVHLTPLLTQFSRLLPMGRAPELESAEADLWVGPVTLIPAPLLWKHQCEAPFACPFCHRLCILLQSPNCVLLLWGLRWPPFSVSTVEYLG